ncbi:MAG TPA: hypothetical protein VGE74_24910 [Gemmata sp.]
MLAALFADGFASGASNKLAEFVIKGLAVGGGFLLGYFLGGFVAWALDRWVFAHRAPAQLKRLCALLGGVALAIAVALIVFGSGGGGLFGGGGPGDAKGTAGEDKGQQPPPVAPKEETKSPPPKIEPKVDVKPTPGDVRISILGGADVRDGKFYIIGTDPTPRTLDELKKAIADRPKEPGQEVVLVFRFAKEPLSDSHPEMKRLSAWVKETKLLSRFE